MNLPNKSRLSELESAIDTGLRSIEKAGAALKEINELRLYEEAGFSTFEAYCKERWNISRSYGYRLIQAHTVKMSPIGDKVQNEHQARKLIKEQKEPSLRAKIESEAKSVTPVDYDPDDEKQELLSVIREQQEEIEKLRDHNAIEAMPLSEEGKLEAVDEMKELREKVFSLETELVIVRAKRDSLMEENGRLKRQIAMLKKK